MKLKQNTKQSTLKNCTARFPAKTEQTEDIDVCGTSNGRARSNENEQLEKRYNYAAAVRGKPKSASKIEERLQQAEKVEDERVPELLTAAKN